MVDHSKLSRDLRENILAVISGSCTHEQLNRLIAVSHALAGSFLASKSTSGSLRAAYGLSSSDLAYDCIAELFTQNEEGGYVQLCAYFAGLSLATAREEEILSHLRRLVFSKVNQSIFRLYSEADPSLAKILRNIKLAIHSLKNFEEVESFGESCIAPSLCDSMEHLQPFDREELEQGFLLAVRGNELVPDLLAKLSLFLREQNNRSRILPLVTVGLLFRVVYETKELRPPDSVAIDDTLVASDTEAIIEKVCVGVQQETIRKYVGSGKVARETFELYFHVVREELCNKFLGRDGHDTSLFEGLQQRIPGLTKDEYTSLHRNKIEYLLKLTHKKALKELKKV